MEFLEVVMLMVSKVIAAKVVLAGISPVKVGYRNNKGGHTEDRQDQQLPGPEPIVDRGSHSAAGGDA